ncbi:MAG TPA: gamma carbonic anhydrase family protein [Tissierellia bacterium]|nr:gamma carbonic anhydrase family protein [Tissierellia bacterium]
MKIKTFEGITPAISPKSYVAEYAVLAGDVRLADYASVWHFVSARGDVNAIRIGRYSNIQDNAVLHVTDESACIIGDYVTVGHGAILHGCTIDDHVLVGMGATVLSGARIGRGSIVAAGAVVKEGADIPPNSLVAGVPAKILRTLEGQMEAIHAQALKYKTLWSVRYRIDPELDGESYHGEDII